MPTVSIISAPYWKGYILVECADGKCFKYVRNVLRDSKGNQDSTGKLYYTWGDSLGDSFIKTGDTRGRILFDYQKICALWSTQKLLAGKYLLWPEVAGDTATLIRPNREQLFPVNISADTYSYRMLTTIKNVNTLMRIQADQVQSISLIQERIPDWYKGSYNIGTNY